MKVLVLTLLGVLGLSQIEASRCSGNGGRGMFRYNDNAMNEYQYSLERQKLKEAEVIYQNKDTSLNKEEAVVDHYLNYQKWVEFDSRRYSGFPSMRPLDEELDNIKNSEVYRLLKSFPKGGILHSHEVYQVSLHTLLDIVWESDDFQYLYILPENSTTKPWKTEFYINPPENELWINVASTPFYTKENIYDHHVLLKKLTDENKAYPSDEILRWNTQNPLWTIGYGNLIRNLPIRKAYLQAMYQAALDEGVQYLETNLDLGGGSYSGLFVLDPSPEYAASYGRKYLDSNGDMDCEVAMEVQADFIAANPAFISHRRLYENYRFLGSQSFGLENAARLVAKYPQHVAGYDFAVQEDKGYSSLFFLEELLDKRNDGDLNYYLHTTETKHPDDLMYSTREKDPVGAPQNAYDNFLLGSKRIGHGYGLMTKHPFILALMKERDIAIEVNLVSGEVLGDFPDPRVQPGITYFRSGGPVVLGSDDPGIYGNDFFTVDWYQAFMSWGLDLADMRKLALTSLTHSGMSKMDSSEAIESKWKPMWNQYIATIYDEACAATLDAVQPSFARILPRTGPMFKSIRVQIFGKHFERGICNEESIKCRFGDIESVEAKYITNQEITCVLPKMKPNEVTDGQSVAVSITFDGTEYFETGEVFTFYR
ncbi:hypothetical protein CAPTEDRAFT_218760 [Capitella teleta]|uniref:Uncharacterized protein n=1 Tax=Capitella teleta TaxID=283909 RepID=R7UFG3_CAPTE|nr:hypothetical protein CAPTEDRAFT_218760 [Capitella teleta]|eukprot:ELU04955.1 hypothetical protein CAPTEDRAFT_218760 [Capitella teleta]